MAGQAKAGRQVVKVHYGKGWTYGEGVGIAKPLIKHLQVSALGMG